MLVRFWGTRGSLPVALGRTAVRAKVREALLLGLEARLDGPESVERFLDQKLSFSQAGSYGGDSSCVQIEPAGCDEIVICDAGSGLRELGNRLIADRGPTGHVVHILLSHLHWDHIMGFPFFSPAYVAGNHVRIYGCHEALEDAFRGQQAAPCFPVPFDALGASIEFVRIEPGARCEIAGLAVTAQVQRHGGDSYGYRFEQGGRSVVYSTDGEHRLELPEETEAVVSFFRDADLVIFDAMYSLADSISIKKDWGHSSNLVGVDLCLQAGVRHYCMFHHEPMHDDATIERILHETRRYEEISRQRGRLEVSSAYDGLEIAL